MTMKLQTPRGVKDFLPEETRWKLELETKLRQVFGQWAYEEVVTPTFELYDTLNLGDGTSDEMYRFLGRNGELLALRSEITTQIVRMVATRFQADPKPLRLSYHANVFRHDDVQVGFQREFYQAGVELIGSDTPAADGEAIALAIRSIQAVGVQDFRVDIGQVQYFHGLMSECQCPQISDQVRQALLHQDYVGLKQIIQQADLDRETKNLLLKLPSLRGGDEVLKKAYAATKNKVAQAAVDNIRDIYRLLEAHGVADAVQIDFGMVKSLEYYTGMVMEGYTPNLGFSLGGGGRYNSLSARFGTNIPAVGFALGLERLMLVLERQGLKPAPAKQSYLVLPKNWVKALAYASKQRANGYQVEVDVQGLSFNEGLRYAQAKQIAWIATVGDDEPQIVAVCAENGE